MKLILFHPRAERFKSHLLQYNIDYETNFDKLKENISNYDGLLAFGLDESINLSNIKWIQSLAAGVDWIFKNPTLNEKTIITRVTEGLERPLFEYTLSKIMYYYQNEHFHNKNQKNKVWDRLFAKSIVDKNILIVGTGKIGKYIGEQLNHLGMNVYGVNSRGYEIDNFIKCYTFDEIDESIKYDVVVNILPATKDTNHIFNEAFFKTYKMDLFINIGRGNAVDVRPLVNELQNQEIKMAVLDVFEEEPLPLDSPLWEVADLRITPHIAGSPSMHHSIQAIKKNLNSVLNNKEVEDKVSIVKGY